MKVIRVGEFPTQRLGQQATYGRFTGADARITITIIEEDCNRSARISPSVGGRYTPLQLPGRRATRRSTTPAYFLEYVF
ncbi:MAG: hypothetical protein WA830_23315 [Candidatus Sulfotelmatobacter sp.]